MEFDGLLSENQFITSSGHRPLKHKTLRNIPISAFLSLFLSTAYASSESLSYRIDKVLHHDESRFTQGLSIDRDILIESSGGYGRSLLSRQRLGADGIEKSVRLPQEFFGEGVTQSPRGLLLLTWREGIALLFDRNLTVTRHFNYRGEGWGITFDGRAYVMSDGSPKLQFRDLEHFSTQRTLLVHDDGAPVSQLNELEYAKGFILANVWHSDRIAFIAPDTGKVRAWLDLANLKRGFKKPEAWDPSEHVLNGIAYDPEHDQLWVTGKCWPAMFVLSLDRWPEPSSP